MRQRRSVANRSMRRAANELAAVDAGSESRRTAPIGVTLSRVCPPERPELLPHAPALGHELPDVDVVGCVRDGARHPTDCALKVGDTARIAPPPPLRRLDRGDLGLPRIVDRLVFSGSRDIRLDALKT